MNSFFHPKKKEKEEKVKRILINKYSKIIKLKQKLLTLSERGRFNFENFLQYF